MEEKIVRFLNEHNMTITTVESCTGGLIAARLVNVSGASNVFSEGYVTYSENAKAKMVGVNPETIEKYNVVSEEVAYEMASGGAKTANADVAVSVTGVAGPLGGTKEIPVGTVCIGVYYKNNVITGKFLFNGDRLQVRNQAVDKAFEMVWNEISSS
ncbi:MAG: CinA family protein [Lachnospiraceae bacterium]|nr:CinA family protein [Clostridiales bacterium]MDD6294257.1 CinA family protein [Eubacteriales bacterium]MDY2607584.1 CinA family protein [Lachnospiraceae bacterium]